MEVFICLGFTRITWTPWADRRAGPTWTAGSARPPGWKRQNSASSKTTFNRVTQYNEFFPRFIVRYYCAYQGLQGLSGARGFPGIPGPNGPVGPLGPLGAKGARGERVSLSLCCHQSEANVPLYSTCNRGTWDSQDSKGTRVFQGHEGILDPPARQETSAIIVTFCRDSRARRVRRVAQARRVQRAREASVATQGSEVRKVGTRSISILSALPLCPRKINVTVSNVKR